MHLEAEINARGEELTRVLGRPIVGMDVFLEAARLGDITEHEWTYVRKDGTRLIESSVVTAMRDSNGKIVGFMGILRDVTEPKRIEAALRESETRFRRIMSNLQDFVAQVTTEGILRICFALIPGATGVLVPTNCRESPSSPLFTRMTSMRQ